MNATYEDFSKLQLRVGTIREAEPIPKSEKLIKLQVDLGEPELRQILAGIAKFYPPADLIGRQIVVIANLEPRKMMGEESQGMLLAADTEGRPILLQPSEEVPEGSPVK